MTSACNEPDLATLLKQIGVIIRTARRSRGFTQTGLAAQCALHVSHVSKIERGGANATLASLLRIAAPLGITLPELFQQLPSALPLQPPGMALKRGHNSLPRS